MAKPTVLQSQYNKGMRQDEPRTRMLKGAVWNAVDYIPELDDAPIAKRGGWAYASDDISVTKATASYVTNVSYVPFAAGSQLVAIDEDGELYTIATNQAVTDKGATTSATPICKLAYHAGKLIIPQSDGTTAPKYYDGSAAPGALAGSPPACKHVCVYKDMTVLGNSSAKPTYIYFSDFGDPTTWDTTNTLQSFSGTVTGLAALPSVLMVFSGTSTARMTGTVPPGTGTDMQVQDPLFNVGCTDARSIAVNGSYAVFANPQGIYRTNGTVFVEDVTALVGLKQYWTTLLASYSSTWTLAGGFIQNKYIISVMDGSTFKDCLMIDFDAMAAIRMSNIKATSFAAATTIGAELYYGNRAAPRVSRLSTIFTPSSTVKNDGDGTAVAGTLEWPYFGEANAITSWKNLYLEYDCRDSASDNPVLSLYYVMTPEGNYVSNSAFAETTDFTRARVPVHKSGLGAAFKIVQANASSHTRIYTIAGDVHSREGSRLS